MAHSETKYIRYSNFEIIYSVHFDGIKLFIRDTYKCTFDIYKNKSYYRSYMFRRNSSSARQEIPRILLSPKVDYSVH
jgi:hypothetical protein